MAKHVKLSDLLIFTNQFASMMRSQLQLVDVLDNLAQETPGADLRGAIEDLAHDVRSGVDFGDALANHPGIFSDIFVNVVRSGMESGRLAESLTQVSVYLQKADALSRKVKGALTYPAFMLLVFFGVFNAMVFFILPRFEAIFSTMGKELPGPTQFLLDVGEVWANNWYYIVGGVVFLWFAFLLWIATQEGRYTWDHYKLKMPVVGNLWRMSSLARFLRTFAVQLHNEVALLKALHLSAYATGNAYVENAILLIAEDVERGISISQSFREYDVFSGIVLQMVSAGEEAGTLAELLLSASDYFEQLLDNQTQVVTGLINPILTVVMGFSIAGMMVAAFLPVFSMGSVVG